MSRSESLVGGNRATYPATVFGCFPECNRFWLPSVIMAATERPLWAARKYRAKRICQANSENSHKWESQPLFRDFSNVGIFCSLLASMGWDGIIEKNSNL